MRAAALALLALLLTVPVPDAALAQGSSLRFYGHGVDDIDRVKIRIDDPALPSDPAPPVDVGATDFTIDLFLRARAAENDAPAITCGDNYDWIYGNILVDRDRFNQGRSYGLSIAGGLLAFGLNNDTQAAWTLCSTANVLDATWHHVAVQRRRSDGRLWLHVDGVLEAEVDGPDGDISYPDDGFPTNNCGEMASEPCLNSDPFLVLGAEKHDAGSEFPSFSGWLDELRYSDTLRYGGASFTPPTAPYVPDANTVALYHFDEETGGPCTGAVLDTSGATGGPSDGVCRFGGSPPSGPVYEALTPFGGSVSGVPALGLPALAFLAGLAAASGYALARRRR